MTPPGANRLPLMKPMKQVPGTPRDQLPSGPSVLAQWQQMSAEPGALNSVQLSPPYDVYLGVGLGGRRRENEAGEDSVKTEQIPTAGSTVMAGKLRGSKVVAARSKFQRSNGLRSRRKERRFRAKNQKLKKEAVASFLKLYSILHDEQFKASRRIF
ncbi:hypothetical protein L3X38_024625 [Prunus dulcis]|uniref:Uncharacterized protein n=1 Tax=Prunus dulcis TaxID=3755 RepID=A0AAD4Z5L8_PRUDU|nr:hypothetical protein L3X38_024625 [Prunus dulcis]